MQGYSANKRGVETHPKN